MTIVRPIAIDLGATRTGCFFAGAGDPADGARGLVVEADKDALTLQQTGRRQMRHLRRNYKRRRLAKRLVLLWLAHRWPSDADAAEREVAERFIRGLMNRRGFTHFSLDEKIDLERLEEGREGCEALGLIEPGDPFEQWIKRQVADPDQARRMLERDEFRLRDISAGKGRKASPSLSEHLRDRLGEGFDKGEIKSTANTLAHIRSLLAEAAQSDRTGHKPRRRYFEALRTDLATTEKGQLTLRLLRLDASALANVLGHISNLNLPALRGYFHDLSGARLHSLDPYRFRDAWAFFFRRWTLVGEAGERREQFRRARQTWLQRLDGLKTTADAVALRDALWNLLITEDPGTSIPPFEAQTNRRPPECQSLLLTPSALDRAVNSGATTWRAWSQALQRACPDLAEGIDVVAAADARVIGRESLPEDPSARLEAMADAERRWRDARFLQRLLERSRDRDPYALRLLTAGAAATGSASRRADEARAQLERDLGSQHVEAFLAFTRRYYDESREARSGIWMPRGESLMTRCDAHPPHKRNQIDVLVAQVLALGDLGEPGLADCVREACKASASPGSSIAGSTRLRARKVSRVLADSADLVKRLGGDLRLARERGLFRLGRCLPLRKPEIEALEAYAYASAAAAAIGQALELDQATVQRFANPYSLAQLNQLLFDDPSGFSSTCRGCTLDNAWRARLDSEGRANATRLPADTIRPFDGVLARLLEAKAGRIAKAFVEGLPDPAAVGEIEVPILIEENRFSFVAQLAEIKGQPASRINDLRKRLEARREEDAAEWTDKRQRIRQDGGGVCPYCGEAVGDEGDFDHIVGQAVTRDVEGYAFDSEANLVLAHRHCNQRKGRRLFGLNDLAPAWLQRQFGTCSIEEVERAIAGDLEPWLEDRSERRSFHQLEEALRRTIRHALFMPSLRDRVLVRLAMQNVARVNGTQRWFGRRLVERIRSELAVRGIAPDRVRFSLHRIPANEVSSLRRRLSEAEPRLAKSERQGPYSHVIDAALVYAVASTQPSLRRHLGLRESPDEPALLEYLEPDRALAMLPKALDIRRLERTPIHDKDHPWHRPIFKANPIGERFVPLMVDAEARLWAGFDLEANRFELKPPKPTKKGQRVDPRLDMLRALWPLLATAPASVDPAAADLLQGLARIAAERPHGVLWLHVDRGRAFAHWQAVRRSPEDLPGQMLDKLVYRIQRVPIEPLLFPADGKASATRDAMLKSDNFRMKLDLPGGKGQLELPAAEHWRKLLDDPRLAPHLGRKLRKAEPSARSPNEARPAEASDQDGLVLAVDWAAIAADHFGQSSRSRAHRRVRQVFALPRLATASGGFRVARRSPAGKPVYQLLQVEKGAYSGFARDPESRTGFDAGRTALLPLLERSPAVTPVDRQAPVEDVFRFGESVSFEPATLPALAELGIERLELFAGSSVRRKLRATVRWSALPSLFGASVPGDPAFDIGGTELEVASEANAADRSALARLDQDPAFAGKEGRERRQHRSKELKDACRERAKAAKSRLARLLSEAIGLPGLAPREDRMAIESWDKDVVRLSWTCGTGVGRDSEDSEEAEGGGPEA